MIIFTSLVFVAVLVTSYWYFADLDQRNRGKPLDIEIEDGPGRDARTAAGKETNNGNALLWTFELNGGPAAAPTVLRHDSASRFILVQDAYHILHAISPAGEKLWNAQLGGAILDSIQQLPDRSLVFATAERLYRIDTQGDPLPGFSLRLPQAATKGAVASVESNDRIRIDVATRKGVLSVDGRGTRLGNTSRRAAQRTDDENGAAIESLAQRPDVPSDCGPYAFTGALDGDGQVYLLCGGDGTLRCYVLN